MSIQSIFRFILLLSIILATIAKISVRKGRLIDEKGGQLIFHGLNVVSKVPPYMTAFNQNDMKLFESWGINGIRLGVMWPGVEPKKGQFNETYLQHMRQTVQKAGDYGIYTLVEFHQDLFSQKFCADGVPAWAIPDQISKGFPHPISLKKYQFNETGYPKPKDCQKHPWGQYYATQAVCRGFEAIWNNKFGMRDLFVNYWKKVAQTFKNSQKVIAYEIMNEPWPGNLYRDPLVMVPGLSELINLQPAYHIIANQIRKVDPDHSICFEPVTWLNYFRSGFTHPPGGKEFANTSIFCYHYYNPPTFNLDKFMKARMKDVKRLNTGGLLSQFYVINAQGEKNIVMMDKCDQHLQSWFGWIYPIQSRKLPRHLQSQDRLHSILYDQNGQPNSELIKGITRTYAPRVSGETIQQYYDTTTKRFVLSYYLCNSCGDTLIFVSTQYIYQKGFLVDLIPRGSVAWEQHGQYRIKINTKNLPQRTKIIVIITAL